MKTAGRRLFGTGAFSPLPGVTEFEIRDEDANRGSEFWANDIKWRKPKS